MSRSVKRIGEHLSPAIEQNGAGALASYLPDRSMQRLLGAFYTPQSAAEYMANWTIRNDGDRVLEPCYGNGIFLRAAQVTSRRKRLEGIRLYGVEIDKGARDLAIAENLLEAADSPFEDFLTVAPFKVDAVIGNPPYVRLRNLSPEQRRAALTSSEAALGQRMDPSGSVWMSFVLHAMEFLKPGGRLAFVLPYEFTYVRYARVLWKLLQERFGSIEVLRTHERLFPDLLQEVVILQADDYLGSTAHVQYRAFERVSDLFQDQPIIDQTLNIGEIINGRRVFIKALLDQDLLELLSARLDHLTVPVRELMSFNIGYVAGNKDYFHPNENIIEQMKIPDRSLKRALISARSMRGSGLFTSSLGHSQLSKLFLPDPLALSQGESDYIAWGEENGVSNGYKCRTRKPWYVVPGVRVPDVLLSVFSERPALQINDAGLVASNSLLCGYSQGCSAERFAAGWYSSLTLLQCELEVHALGGGVMVLVPNEAGSIRVPKSVQVASDYAQKLEEQIQINGLSGAYCYGDEEVLIRQLGLSRHDIDLIRGGIESLKHWRTSARRNRSSLTEHSAGSALLDRLNNLDALALSSASD